MPSVPVDRALATVRRIAALKPIPGADRVCTAVLDGWQVVVAVADGFRVGDLVVYFEIDSFLPPTPRFEFLRKSSFAAHPTLGEGFRLKTAKIRGQLSQGLVLPINAVFPDGTAGRELRAGTDLTAELGVRKWEAVVAAGDDTATPAGGWPAFLKKTDQQRVQNIASTLWDASEDPSLAHEPFEVTLKLDGSSCTVFHNAGEVGVCSRNLMVWQASAAEAAKLAAGSSSGTGDKGKSNGSSGSTAEGRFSQADRVAPGRPAPQHRDSGRADGPEHPGQSREAAEADAVRIRHLGH